MPYRAPELFDVKTGKTLDEKVDIWVSFVSLCASTTELRLIVQSLGCTLFAVAYGHSPFETEGASVGMAVMSGRYRHPANNGGYSEKVKGLIDGMLVVDPERRPDIDQVRPLLILHKGVTLVMERLY